MLFNPALFTEEILLSPLLAIFSAHVVIRDKGVCGWFDLSLECSSGFCVWTSGLCCVFGTWVLVGWNRTLKLLKAPYHFWLGPAFPNSWAVPWLSCVKKLVWRVSATMGGKPTMPSPPFWAVPSEPLSPPFHCPCQVIWSKKCRSNTMLSVLFLLFFWMLFHQSFYCFVRISHNFKLYHFPIGLETYNTRLSIYSQDCLCDFSSWCCHTPSAVRIYICNLTNPRNWNFVSIVS